MSDWVYQVFGLNIAMPREVPTLHGARVGPEAPPDVRVAFGDVPELPVMETVNEDLDVSWSNNDLVIAVEDVGRFLIRDGGHILVTPCPGATVDEVDLYLAGSVMGALLHQRGILPLHCNGFVHEGQAILICGDSGAGKSTLAAWFETHGYALLTDDVCAVTFAADGSPMGHRGIPRLRLWNDAIEAMKRDNQILRPIPWADGKYELEMAQPCNTGSLPIAAIYHLIEAGPDSDFSIVSLKGLDAANVVTANIYRRRIADLVGQSAGYLRNAVNIAAKTPIFLISRPKDMEKFDKYSRKILDHLNRIENPQMNEFSLNDIVKSTNTYG